MTPSSFSSSTSSPSSSSTTTPCIKSPQSSSSQSLPPSSSSSSPSSSLAAAAATLEAIVIQPLSTTTTSTSMIHCNHPPLRLLPPPRQLPLEQKYHDLQLLQGQQIQCQQYEDDDDDDNNLEKGNLVRYQLSDMIRNFINVDHCKNDTTNNTQYIPIPIEAKRLTRLLLSKSSISNSKFSNRTSFIPCRKGCNSSNNNITSTKTSTNTKNKHNSLFFLAGPGEIIEFPIATATNVTATAAATATSNATSSMINYTNDRSYIQSQYNNDDNNLVTPSMNLCKSAEFMLSSGDEDEEEEQQHDDKCIIIAVSWGLDDGIIILYRRFHQKENNKKMEWIAIGCIIPNDDVINSAIHDKMDAAAVDAAVVTEEEKNTESSIPIPANNNNSNQSWLAKLINVQRSLFSSSSSDNNDNVDFATLKKDIIEAGSMRVTSILPIQTSDHKTFLVISRLGGYLEVISIPLDILLDFQKGLSKSKSSRRSDRNKKNVGHYTHNLIDLNNNHSNNDNNENVHVHENNNMSAALTTLPFGQYDILDMDIFPMNKSQTVFSPKEKEEIQTENRETIMEMKEIDSSSMDQFVLVTGGGECQSRKDNDDDDNVPNSSNSSEVACFFSITIPLPPQHHPTRNSQNGVDTNSKDDEDEDGNSNNHNEDNDNEKDNSTSLSVEFISKITTLFGDGSTRSGENKTTQLRPQITTDIDILLRNNNNPDCNNNDNPCFVSISPPVTSVRFAPTSLSSLSSSSSSSSSSSKTMVFPMLAAMNYDGGIVALDWYYNCASPSSLSSSLSSISSTITTATTITATSVSIFHNCLRH